MSLKPGDTLLNGQYVIEDQLGTGGFGAVYRARDAHLHEDVAIKELVPGLLGDEETLKRFLAEAKATMRLSHDRIVRTHHVFAEEDASGGTHYYIVMEHMPGGSLEEMLEATGNPPVEDAVRIAAQVAEGLAYAHGRGVVHCDLKPANILFTAPEDGAACGEAKVADFGIAHVSERMLTRTWQTSEGFVAGTLPYMSPEQTAGRRDDPRVDVYALGALLYQMVTGRTYIDFGDEDTPFALADNIMRIHNKEPVAPSRYGAQVPAWLDGVILKALRKAPEERYGTIEEFRAALEAGESVAGEDAGAPGAPAVAHPGPPSHAKLVAPPAPPAPAGAVDRLEDASMPAPPTDRVPGPESSSFGKELSRFIEQAQLAALRARPEALSREEQKQAARDAALQDRLKIAEEKVRRAAERVQKQLFTNQIAPALQDLDQALKETGLGLERVGPDLAGVVPHPGSQAPSGDGESRWQLIGIEMVSIPEGAFPCGEDKEPVYSPAFALSKTPVTNTQYAAFVEATSYPAPRHWKKGQMPKDRAHHPVTRITWYDAQAFCGWAGCRLPSEQEWEKAARGPQGLAYPWGDEWEPGRCNTVEAGLGDATPVDAYPQGASPHGVLDMAGNVWEWCQDLYDRQTTHRVRRGGSYGDPASQARCATRRRRDPESASGRLGFRVALSDPSGHVGP